MRTTLPLLLLSAAACTASSAEPLSAGSSAASGSSPAPAMTGAQVFDSICSRCHGAEGRGGPPDSTGVGPRNFHDAAFQAARTDDELKRVIREGKNGHMPGFGSAFDAAQLDGLVARIRSYNPQEAAR
jgi:mono/diheme cytochrome c family protein